MAQTYTIACEVVHATKDVHVYCEARKAVHPASQALHQPSPPSQSRLNQPHPPCMYSPDCIYIYGHVYIHRCSWYCNGQCTCTHIHIHAHVHIAVQNTHNVDQTCAITNDVSNHMPAGGCISPALYTDPCTATGQYPCKIACTHTHKRTHTHMCPCIYIYTYMYIGVHSHEHTHSTVTHITAHT